MKKQLQEVTIIRPIIIILLVLMHSFTMYSGEWPLPEGIGNVRSYFWVQKASFAFMLEMFAFISGYLFAYQINELKKKITFRSLLKDKFKRLIIPCIVFSVLYAAIFYDKFPGFISFVYKICSGIGHMWFLNMLFWCFLGTYLLLKIKIREGVKIVLLFLLSIFSFIPLPFQMTSTLYYMFFFYLSFLVFRNKETLINKFANVKSIIIFGILFLVLFISLTLFKEQVDLTLSTETAIIYKAILLSISNLSRLIYSTIGLLWFYVFVMYLLKIIRKIPDWIISSNTLCMGIYLIHQFILKYLYYKTNIPQYLGTYWLPWIGFIVALFISLLLSYFIKKTRIGKNIL